MDSSWTTTTDHHPGLPRAAAWHWDSFPADCSAARKSDYQVASHSIGPFLLLMSMFGTTMTAFALVGSSGEAFREGIGVYGMLASSSGIVHSLCFFLIGVKVWKIRAAQRLHDANRILPRSAGQ